MIDLRPLKPEEFDAARKLVPENCTEPPWASCLGIFRDGELAGIVGAQMRCVLEPLYLSKEDPILLLMAASEIDGFFRAKGAGGYEFFVGDDRPQMQKFVERHLPVGQGREKPGKFYFRSLL